MSGLLLIFQNANWRLSRPVGAYKKMSFFLQTKL